MFKIYKILILLFFVTLTLPTKAHVQHYENLDRIEFDIYRNNHHIGKHIFSFKKFDDLLTVESEIFFEIKKLGIVFYKYHVKGTEIYKDGKLIKFNSKTDQNGKEKYVNMVLENGEYIIRAHEFGDDGTGTYQLSIVAKGSNSTFHGTVETGML